MLKNLIHMKPYKLFIAILMPFLMSIILIILIQSSFLYSSFEKLALEMIYKEQTVNLKNISHNVSVMQQTARALCTQAFFDGMINDILYSEVDEVNYNKYINKLSSYKNIYPFLHSIYVYNGKHIYATPSYSFFNELPSFYDQKIVKILENMQNYKTHSIIPRMIPDTEYGSSKIELNKFSYVYSYLFYDSQMQSGKINEAIILNIAAEWIWEGINNSKNEDDNRVFILDNKNRIITMDVNYEMMSDLSDHEFVELIQNNKESVGSMIMKVDGIDSFVTFAKTNVLDWNLVSIIPYYNITKDIDKLKIKTYLFVLFIMFISIIISVYLSRRVYFPLKTLIYNFNIMVAEKRNDLFYNRQHLLRKLINNRDSCNIELFSNQFLKYDLTLNSFNQFLMIVIKIDSYSAFCNKYNLEDRELMKYGIMNIITELLSPSYKNECVDMGEDIIAVIIDYPHSEPPSNNQAFITIIKAIQMNSEKYLNVSLSFSFSNTGNTIEGLNLQYGETIDLSYYRLLLGPKAVIFRNNLDILITGFKYPLEKDKMMTEALLLGHLEDAKKAYMEIIQYASQYSITFLNTTFTRLLLSINYKIEAIQSEVESLIKFNFNIHLLNIQKLESLEEVHQYFFNLFENILSEMEQKNDNKYVKLIEEVTVIIENEYPNPNISLEIISESFNLSPAYLSRLFKRYKSISITQYINNVRLKKAESLLSDTDESILKIMNDSGFLSRSHFFTLFKKNYGVTPNQYRSNSRSK